MPAYRIHRLKDHLRQHFRFAPHVSGTADLKPRDYQQRAASEGDEAEGETILAESPYAAYFTLRASDSPLEVGDVLEPVDGGALRIFKFVGFEEARWVLPEPKPEQAPAVEGAPAAVQ